MAIETQPTFSVPDINEIVAVAGNNNLKLATLAVMYAEDTRSFGTKTASHALREKHRIADPAWPDMNIRTPYNTCAALQKAGLVYPCPERAHQQPAYRISDRGQATMPLIGFLMDISLRYPPRLSGYFGATQSSPASADRPCVRRIAFMRVISAAAAAAEDRKLTIARLDASLDIGARACVATAQNLARAGVITTDPDEKVKPRTVYFPALIPHDYPDRSAESGKASLSQDILTVIGDHFRQQPGQPIDAQEIVHKLIGRGYRQTVQQLAPPIRSVLIDLAHRQILRAQRLGAAKPADRLAWVTDGQRQAISALLEAIDGATTSSPGYKERGLRLVASILSEPYLFDRLIQKAAPSQN